MREFLFGSLSTTSLTVISVIAVIAFLVLTLLVFVMCDDFLFGGSIKRKCLFCVLCILLLGSSWFMCEAPKEKRERKYEHIVECIENGYTLYVNGTEVELSHITLEEYSLSAINVYDEVKEVHIAANK